MSGDGSPWPRRDPELRRLWAEGLSGSEIADRMKLTKNAVIGRVHRLNLPARRSPIIRDPNAPPAPPPEVQARIGAGKDPLPPFHPIAADVLRRARRLW